jgi:hypothetical protein
MAEGDSAVGDVDESGSQGRCPMVGGEWYAEQDTHGTLGLAQTVAVLECCDQQERAGRRSALLETTGEGVLEPVGESDRSWACFR